MIISIDNAILHILDAVSGVTVFSDKELDPDESSFGFISKHIEKAYPDPGLRYGSFKDNSGFAVRLKGYLKGEEGLAEFSAFIGSRIYDAVYGSDKPESYDVIVCDCTVDSQRIIGVLMCANKAGFTHRVEQADGAVKNGITNYYSILPPVTQKISECAFVNADDFSIRFSGKKRKIDGETADPMADMILECDYDLSNRESFSKIQKIIRGVSDENKADATNAVIRMREYVKDAVSRAEDDMKVEELAETVFSDAPAAKDEFIERAAEEYVPETVKITDFVTKRVSSNVKIITDTGIELSFPAEYYADKERVEIINNADGTISLKLNNIGSITNKN